MPYALLYCSYNQTFGQIWLWTGNLEVKLRKKKGLDGRVAKEHIKHTYKYSMLLTMRLVFHLSGRVYYDYYIWHQKNSQIFPWIFISYSTMPGLSQVLNKSPLIWQILSFFVIFLKQWTMHFWSLQWVSCQRSDTVLNSTGLRVWQTWAWVHFLLELCDGGKAQNTFDSQSSHL